MAWPGCLGKSSTTTCARRVASGRAVALLRHTGGRHHREHPLAVPAARRDSGAGTRQHRLRRRARSGRSRGRHRGTARGDRADRRQPRRDRRDRAQAMTAPNRPSAPPERLAPPTRPAIIVTAAEHPGLKTYLAVIWHRRRLVIALPIVFGILAGVFSILRPRQYDARAAFVATEPQSM